jgi:indolepyruvate ferredoxin oxidoreductase beta subunit
VYDPHRIDPLPVSIGAVERPGQAHIEERIRARAPRSIAVEAFRRSLELGNGRVQNVVMLGAASNYLEFPPDACRQVLRQLVRPDALELNLRAFDIGRTLTGQH